jgi:hypothetical protein
MKKICNPSLLSKNYFVLSSLLAKMSLYVSFFITSNKNWNFKGSYAFHKKPPRRSKIWKKNLLWILWAASSSPPPSPHVATPTKVSTAATAKIMCNIEFKLKTPKQHTSDIAPSTPGDIRAPERILLKMPQNLHSYDKQVCVSEGFGDQLSLFQPTEEGEEYEFINSMIDELNAKCGLELSHEYSLYRPSEPDRKDVFKNELEKVVLMGGGHSSRMTDELDDTCLEVVDISVKGWRISEKAVEDKVKELTEIVSQCDEKRTTIVYQLYDNCSFFAKKQDGTRSLPETDSDGKYHV